MYLFMGIFAVCLFWGVVLVLGYVFPEEKCAGCLHYGERRHMKIDISGKYWHPSCLSLDEYTSSVHIRNK